MRNPRLIVPFLFLPAGLGLLAEIFQAPTVPEKIVTFALALFCLELARMAFVDLENVASVAGAANDLLADARLSHFRIIVISTIALEIVGFCLAALFVPFSQPLLLPFGAIVIISSQLWFNLLAGIQLWPTEVPAIQPWGIRQRLPVLIANVIGLGLLGLWVISEIRLWLALGLAMLIILFLLIKYAIPALGADT
ncbi:MAG: hypothetical protein AAFS04_15985 [Cyanobacteria bacterium J06631_9]